MKVYVAGKITGNPNYKEEFSIATHDLAIEGHQVLNPADLPSGFEQADYHRICMAMIDCCDMVCFLPSWVDSKGSHLEMGYAKGTKKKIRFL
jgi:nucleoside 2-deoxyribosyltransferase